MKRSTPGFVAVLGAATILLGTIEKSGDESAKPFAMFIYEAKGETPEEKRLVEATKEVKKKFGKRDKWFQLVDNHLDAEVRIEVLKAWDDKELGVKEIGHIPSTGGLSMRTDFDQKVSRMYWIEFRYTIPGKFTGIMKVEGSSLGEAAKKMPRMMKSICDTYCR